MRSGELIRPCMELMEAIHFLSTREKQIWISGERRPKMASSLYSWGLSPYQSSSDEYFIQKVSVKKFAGDARDRRTKLQFHASILQEDLTQTWPLCMVKWHTHSKWNRAQGTVHRGVKLDPINADRNRSPIMLRLSCSPWYWFPWCLKFIVPAQRIVRWHLLCEP